MPKMMLTKPKYKSESVKETITVFVPLPADSGEVLFAIYIILSSQVLSFRTILESLGLRNNNCFIVLNNAVNCSPQTLG